MHLLKSILFTALLAWFLHQFLPWWAIVIAGFIAGTINGSKSLTGFLGGFLGGMLIWGGLATWINLENDGIMAAKMGELFGNIGVTGILLVTAVFGGILAGFGGLTGNLFRKLMKKG